MLVLMLVRARRAEFAAAFWHAEDASTSDTDASKSSLRSFSAPPTRDSRLNVNQKGLCVQFTALEVLQTETLNEVV